MIAFLVNLIPAPYRLLAFFVLLGTVFAAGGAAAWKLQSWRYGIQIAEIKNDYAARFAIAQDNAHRKEREHEQLARDAEKTYQLAQTENRALAHDLRRLAAESGGLRDPGRRPGCLPADTAPAGGIDLAAAGEAGRFSEGDAGLLSAEAADFILGQSELADEVAAYAWACHAWAKQLEAGR